LVVSWSAGIEARFFARQVFAGTRIEFVILNCLYPDDGSDSQDVMSV
jgi:hypothetical protein